MSSNIPISNEVTAYYHKMAPIKARIQGAIDFLDKKRIKGFNENIFRSNGVSHATGYRNLKSSNPRILKNNLTRKKTGGRKEVVTADEIGEMKKILQNEGLEGRALIKTAGNGGRSRGFRLNN